MSTRAVSLMSVALITACGTTDPDPIELSGSWVLTFPSLSVPDFGLQCTSVSSTVLYLEQDGDQLTAPHSQGLLDCGTSTVVPFTQGTVNGTLHGNRLDLQFEGSSGRFTGTVRGSTASGNVDYIDPTYGVAITGDWIAEKRTPTGAVNLTIEVSSFSGQPLPAVLITLDGDTAVQLPQGGAMALTGLTGGHHLLKVRTDGTQSCGITGGPSGAMTNPIEDIEIQESEPPVAIEYFVGCA